MKRIDIIAYGEPEDVARCVDVDDVGRPDAGEVVFDVLAFPINPADVAFCRGRYRLKPPLPATPGAECIGRVAAVGEGVQTPRIGDLVINLQRENWAQRRRVPAADLIVVPPDIDLLQAAMLRINPPTARLLLTDFVTLTPGDWLVQNVGNSAVGRMVIAFAKALGLRTINVVRRADVMPELQRLGADHCLLDGEDLAARVAQLTRGEPVRLGLDAIAGGATARLAACLVDEGVVCNYGSMSGEDPRIASADLLYRGVALHGFMLGRHLARRSPQALAALYAELAAQMQRAELRAPIDQVYPIERISAALVHARRGGNRGKVLVTPNAGLS